MMRKVVLSRVAAGMHRLDLPCAFLGFATPPGPADVKVLRTASAWTLIVACTVRHAGPYAAWLRALGASEVLQGIAKEPILLRGTFRQLPAPLEDAVRICRIEHIDLSSDGTAAIITRGSDQQVGRLARQLGAERPAEVPEPVLTARQAELLEYCVSRGYYSIPRRATLRLLSSELGLSTTSLSLALRRAEGKIVLAFVARMRQPETGEAPDGHDGMTNGAVVEVAKRQTGSTASPLVRPRSSEKV